MTQGVQSSPISLCLTYLEYLNTKVSRLQQLLLSYFAQSTITGCNLYADLQHVHRILCLISFDFSNIVFLNIFSGSCYAENNLEIFCPFHQPRYFQESSLDFFAGMQHVQEDLCDILREYSTNHPMPTHFNFT